MLAIQLIKKLFHAFLGYVLWHQILHKWSIRNNDAVILLPSPTDEDCIRYSFKYLALFLETNQFEQALILSTGGPVVEMIEHFNCNSNIKAIVPISASKAEWIIDFYNANMFDSRFVVASLEQPVGRTTYKYLNIGKSSKEELFYMGIYNVAPASTQEKAIVLHT